MTNLATFSVRNRQAVEPTVSSYYLPLVLPPLTPFTSTRITLLFSSPVPFLSSKLTCEN